MSRRRLVYSFLTVVFVLFLSTSAFAAGFALYEGSARGNVIGGGLVGSADDPSAVFYNPAGITQLKGKQAMVGVTAISPMMTIETSGGTVKNDMVRNWFFPPHAYYTQQYNDKVWFGMGLFSRFGLGTEFQANWPGRYNSYKADIQTVELNPNVAYKFSDKLSIAGGLSLMYMNLSLKKKAGPIPGVGDVDSELDGDSWGWGLNAAIQYKPADWVQTGISYRSRVSQHIEGDVKFIPNVNVPGVVRLTNTSAGGNIHLPDMIFAGANFNVTKELSVGGGVYWTRWDSYDKLQIKYGAPLGTGAGSSISTTRKSWDNVYRLLIGAEYKFNPNWDFRIGYAFDQAPEDDATIDYILPDNDRHMYSLGFGYHRNNWALDFSYTLMMILDREIVARPAEGVLNSKLGDGTAHLFGFSYTYKF